MQICVRGLDDNYNKIRVLEVEPGTNGYELEDLFGKIYEAEHPSRQRCSFRCRHTVMSVKRNQLVQKDQSVTVSFGGGGTCKPFCRRLIQPSECKEEAFTRDERLGFGSSGEVYAVTHTATGKKLALKTLRCRSEADQVEILGKYKNLMKIRDARIVPFLAAFRVGEHHDVGVLMPKFRGTLMDKIQEGVMFTNEQLHGVAANILEGLIVLKSQSFVHRDLKPSNIFVAPSHQAGVDFYALGDMETARSLMGNSHVTGGTGTFAHLAPEQIMDYEATPKSDIWGLGTVLHWLVMGGRHPKVLHAEMHRNGSLNLQSDLRSCSSPQMRELIIRMLARDPSDRPPAEVCLYLVKLSAQAHGIDIHTCTCSLPSARNYMAA